MYPGVLIHRDFRIYTFGNFFALNAMWLQRITIAWLGWQMTESATFVGVLAFLLMAPTLLLGPFLGVIADRTDARRASFAVQAGLGTLSALLFIVHRSEILGPGLLAALVFGFGLVMAMHHPLRMTLAPRLVPRDQIAAAVPITSINFNLSRFLGPFAAGAMIAGLGVGPTLAFTSLAFLPLLAALRVIAPRARERTVQRVGFVGELRTGLAHARADTLIARGIALTAIASIAARGVQEILPVIADGAFGRGPAGLGQLTAAAGLGALAASVWLATHPVRGDGRLPRLSLAAGAASLALTVALGWVPTWPFVIACAFGLGATGTLTAVGIQSALQLRLTDDLRGRVMSLWTSTAIGATALGAIALGALADAVGLAAALALVGGAGLAAFVALARRA